MDFLTKLDEDLSGQFIEKDFHVWLITLSYDSSVHASMNVPSFGAFDEMLNSLRDGKGTKHERFYVGNTINISLEKVTNDIIAFWKRCYIKRLRKNKNVRTIPTPEVQAQYVGLHPWWPSNHLRYFKSYNKFRTVEHAIDSIKRYVASEKFKTLTDLMPFEELPDYENVKWNYDVPDLTEAEDKKFSVRIMGTI